MNDKILQTMTSLDLRFRADIRAGDGKDAYRVHYFGPGPEEDRGERLIAENWSGAKNSAKRQLAAFQLAHPIPAI